MKIQDATDDETLAVDSMIILPDKDQEQSLENLDLRARYTELGDIDVNNLQGPQYAKIIDSGAVEHLVDSLAEDNLFNPNALLATVAVQSHKVKVDYNPTLHYPLKLSKTLFGGLTNDGTLTACFTAWKILHDLPPFIIVLKTDYVSAYYCNEGPMSDMVCEHDDCDQDFMWVAFANARLDKSKIANTVD